MKKKILIPTDFSNNAWNAINFTAALFKDQECTFYLLNAFMINGYNTSELMVAETGTFAPETAKTKSENGLAKIMDMLDLKERNKKHTYSLVSQFNDPITAIKSVIEKKDINLVVMGTKGAGNLDTKLFGSHTIEAMENVRNCPILGIPLEARMAPIKEIVFPTSFNTHYKRRELLHLVKLAQIQKAHICILHISKNADLETRQEENKALLEECLEGASFSLHLIGGSNPAAAVQGFVESRNSDMVAFMNRKHSFFTSVFSKPMVKELGMYSKVPLLVMHDLRN